MSEKIPLQAKSTIEEIRERFDVDVERFSNLETGQTATIDAPLAMELITGAAIATTPMIERVLDIGCGAGNNTLKLLQSYENDFICDLNDLSFPMLQRAKERISAVFKTQINLHHGDFRTVELVSGRYDVILAAAVLHHLREDEDWFSVFSKIYDLLKPGGSFWVTDYISHELPPVQAIMWKRYGAYLERMGGPEYREKVFAYTEKEDSPRPVTFQLELMKKVGFSTVELLHKNSCFAAFGGVKA
ncbi:MAG: class I SAM-dependent methyltransferase [Opitutales bacterium]|nr:class I SAM-dependent methyltransferase [Opitutales bacterium]